jgi:AraC-like DNA-binding protein
MAELQTLVDAISRRMKFTGPTSIKAAEAIGRTAGLERLHHLFGLFAILAGAPEKDRRKLASEWLSPLLDEAAAPVVDRVLRYIFANISGEVRMTTAARLAGMTEPTFSRFFKRVSGRNFVSMVRTLRVTKACRLLRQTTCPISDICFEVGFGNLSNFNRHFRIEMGMSPSEYRLHGDGRYDH